MKERTLKEMSRYDFEREVSSMLYSYRVWSDTYTYSMLKSSHITKGKDFSLAHHLDTRDEILLAFQNGMSEKDSVLFTEKAISIAQSNWFSKNVVEKISWTDIKKIELINHSLIFTLEGEIEKVFNIDEIFSKNLDKVDKIMKLLQQLLRIINGGNELLQDSSTYDVSKARKRKKIYITIGVVFAVLFIVTIIRESLREKTPMMSYTSSFSDDKNDIKVDSNIIENQKPKEPIIQIDTLWSDTPKKGYKKKIMYRTINVFNEPYSVTMKSKGLLDKFVDETNTKIVIPVEIPKNTKYWIYRIILSNALIESGEQTQLVREVDQNIKKTSFFGEVNIAYEIYGDVKSLFNNLSAPSKLKPYANVYFIYNKKEAENFQEHKKFKYDIDNSIKNTHSRNGLIKYNKNQFVYLGLEDAGYEDTIYVNLEVVAIVEVTKYYKVEEKTIE